jgi:hypothetical protein
MPFFERLLKGQVRAPSPIGLDLHRSQETGIHHRARSRHFDF